MDRYFDKINIEIFYPGFDNRYDEKIASIHYQVTYPDMNGNPISRVQCSLISDAEVSKDMQLAAWTPSLKYTHMAFNFLKNDNAHADLLIKRSIYYKPGMSDGPEVSQITINTSADDADKFKVIAKTPSGHVHNKVAIGIAELGTHSAPSNLFTTVF